MKIADILISSIFPFQGENKEKIPYGLKNTFEKLFEEANEMIIISDKDGYIKRANRRVEEVLDYSQEELQGENILKIAHPDDEDRYMEFWKKALEEENPKYTIKGLTKNGEVVHLGVEGVAIRENEEIVGILCKAEDVTEFEETRREIKKSKERLRTFFELSPDPAFILDTDGRFVEVNRAFCEIACLPEEDFLGNRFQDADFIEEESLEKAEENFEKRLEGEVVPPYTLELEKPSGDSVYVEINADMVEEDGEPVGILAIARDITEHRRWEKALESAERKFRKLFEVNPDPAFLINTEGVVVEINEAACDVVGYSKEDIIGKTVSELDFFTENTRDKIRGKMSKILAGVDVSSFKIKAETKSGEIVIGEVNHTLFREEGEVIGFFGVVRDITKRERMEKELRRTKERYEDLFKGANELVVTTDPEGYIKRVNEKTVEVSGYSEDELVGESVLKIAPEDQEDKYIQFWKKILEEGESKMTLKTRNKDGSNRWVESGGRPIVEDGEIVEIQYDAQDITERKRMQERQEFLYSLLRHDLRNKISIVEGYQDLLLDMAPSEEQRGYIEKSLKATQGSLELIEKIRTLSKVGKAKLEDTPLNTAIKEAIKSNSSEATEKGIDVEYKECECTVKADSLLEQLFSNLIENSIQHSGGCLIRVQVQKYAEKVEITLEDDGRGIPDDIKDEIFERGFKGKGSGGSGLGLNLVKRIVESYGGSIEVADSDLGGAKFIIELRKT